MKSRIAELDSIRGLAALTVVFHHIFLVVSTVSIALDYSPLRVIVNGRAAVILFFILSGFVLSLPFYKDGKIPYRIFIFKRFLRIYIPYIISISIAITLSKFLSTGGIKGLSDWFNTSWNTPVNKKLLLEHLILIGNVHSNVFNNPIWSLVHEMRISLFFPLIAFLVRTLSWKINLLICLVLSLVGGLNEIFHFQVSNGNHITYLETLHYSSMFIIGALLARNIEKILSVYRQLSRKYKYGFLVIAFITYNYSTVIIIITKILKLPYGGILSEYVIALGGSIFIVMSLGTVRISRLLQTKPLLFLGKISYSLYLYHLIVILSFVYLFFNFMPLWLIYSMVIVVSIIISTVSYYFVEVPSMNLGKLLSKKRKSLGTFQSSKGV